MLPQVLPTLVLHIQPVLVTVSSHQYEEMSHVLSVGQTRLFSTLVTSPHSVCTTHGTRRGVHYVTGRVKYPSPVYFRTTPSSVPCHSSPTFGPVGPITRPTDSSGWGVPVSRPSSSLSLATRTLSRRRRPPIQGPPTRLVGSGLTVKGGADTDSSITNTVLRLPGPTVISLASGTGRHVA